MARLARIVLPDYPHHITQRGNRRQAVFFQEEDYDTYLRLLKEWCGKENVEIWAYCLMTNHVLCGASHKTWLVIGRAICWKPRVMWKKNLKVVSEPADR